RPVDETVAHPHLVRPSVLPREPSAGQHEEDLLVGAVDVRRRRDLPRFEVDAVDADGNAASGEPEVPPGPLQAAPILAARLDVVPVRECHTATMARSASTRAAASAR